MLFKEAPLAFEKTRLDVPEFKVRLLPEKLVALVPVKVTTLDPKFITLVIVLKDAENVPLIVTAKLFVVNVPLYIVSDGGVKAADRLNTAPTVLEIVTGKGTDFPS